MGRESPGLSLQPTAVYVDAGGKVAKALELNAHRQQPTDYLLTCEFDDGSSEDVEPDLVIPCPSGSKQLQLVLPNQNVSSTATHAGPPAHAGPAAHAPGDAHGKNRIVAFFAKTVDDQKIDVHQEGQQMMRVIENAGGVWECKIHPQPTLNDLHHAIASANPCNMRGMHVAGHSRKKCGFIWNKDDAASESPCPRRPRCLGHAAAGLSPRGTARRSAPCARPSISPCIHASMHQCIHA